MWSDRARYMCVFAAALLSFSAVHAQSIALDRARLPAELASLDDDALARIARMSPRTLLAVDATNRVADDTRAAQLGHRLFFDKRLSPASVSCATCHEPARAFTDGRALARGIATVRRNAPSVLDSARRRWNGWDGKHDSVWSQALDPIEHPDEMGGDRTTLVRIVREDADLLARYQAIFGAMPALLAAAPNDPLAKAASPSAAHSLQWFALDEATRAAINSVTANLLKSIGAYERLLLTGDTAFDRLVAALKRDTPNDTALTELSPSALRGLATFVGRGGCFQCHRGAEFTDEEFHNIGLTGANGRVPDDPARLTAIEFLQGNPWNCAGEFSDAPQAPKAHMVRGLKRAPELFGQFRTAPLRGVALTAPFMHDGRFASLEEVIHFYNTLEGASAVGHHGEMVLEPLGLDAAGEADLVAFLQSISASLAKSEWMLDPLITPVRNEGIADQ